MFSGTPNRTKFFSTGRHRSLSLEESAEDEVSPYGIGIEKDGNKPGRRRLNTYISSNNGLPMQRSLEESVDEDGAFAESESCSSTIVNAAQAQGLIAKSELAFFDFLRHHPSYELMPHSSKLVVFDTRLSGRKAFFAM